MDAKTNFKSRLPSRHVTGGPERAPQRWSYLCAMGLASAQIGQPFAGVAEVFKRTPYIAGLKPGGRYVAKDMVEVGGIPLFIKTLLDHGYLHGVCMTVTGHTIAENLKSVKWNLNQDVVCPAVNGAVIHPGSAHEKQSYAEA